MTGASLRIGVVTPFNRCLGLSGAYHAHPIAEDMAKRAIAAGQYNDLHPFSRLAQDLDHEVEARIIGINERIVQNQGYRPSLFQKHVRKGDPRQYGQLLLCAARQIAAPFADPTAHDCFEG
jgi:hypothetical protein